VPIYKYRLNSRILQKKILLAVYPCKILAKSVYFQYNKGLINIEKGMLYIKGGEGW